MNQSQDQQQNQPPMQPVVALGRLHVEPQVYPALEAADVTLEELLARHQSGDWGYMDDAFEAARLNEAASLGEMVTSHYMIWPGGRARSVYVTTDPAQGRQTRVLVVPKSLSE